MAGHTPGEWIAQPEEGTGGTWEVVTEAGEAVANVWPGDLGYEVVPANARLIAASPKLLETGNALANSIGELLQGKDPSDLELHEVLEDWITAREKAEAR
jgi:hypothetical protein